ncbi:MAG: DUF6259 domain-containing protein [Sedimentisphaerales bacterium]
MENCRTRNSVLFILVVLLFSGNIFAENQTPNAAKISFGTLGVEVPPTIQLSHDTIVPFSNKVEFGDDVLKIENSHYLVKISTTPFLSFSSLYNKGIGMECLIENKPSSAFFLWVDNKRIDIKNFKVANVEIDKKAGKASINLNCPEYEVDGKLVISIDDSAEISLDLSFINNKEQEREFKVLFPYFSQISIGDNLQHNYYFFPFMGGWASNVPYRLGTVYGSNGGSVQVVSIYNPSLGGGIYTYTKDKTGRTKTIYLTKRNDPNENVVVYQDYVAPIYRIDDDIWSKDKGFEVAFCGWPYRVKAKKMVALPEVALGLHEGDLKVALTSYSKWAHTWFKAVFETPQWYKDCFRFTGAHDGNGCGIYASGFVKDNNEIVLNKIVKPYDQWIQLAFWQNHSKTNFEGDERNTSWYKHTIGNFTCEEEWGGCEALRGEIQKVQEKGVHVVLYGATPYMAWKYADIIKQHPEWISTGEDGEPVKDYWGTTDLGEGEMRYLSTCPQIEAFQDWLANTNAEIIKNTNADGVFLDTMNLVRPCSSKTHKHNYEYPQAAAEDVLKKIVSAVRAVNPQATVDVETINSDYLAQWTDASWSQTFEPVDHVKKGKFNMYSLCFFRFLFPEVKYTEHATDVDAMRRALFSGVGLVSPLRGDITNDLTGQTVTGEQQMDYQIAVCKLMKENGDVFAGLNPEMLVSTMKDNVFANCFPLATKAIYTIYNKNNSPVEGQIIKAELKTNYHCVELLYDNEVEFDEKTGIISMPISSWEIVCVAQFPNIMEVNSGNDILTIKLNKKISAPSLRIVTDVDSGKEKVPQQEIVENKIQIKLSEYKCGKLIIKLFDGNYLVDERIIKL